MSKIEELEAKVADLVREISELKKAKGDEPDCSSWEGRLVMVRDEEEQEWIGPTALKRYERYCKYPFRVMYDAGYKQANLYHGPHPINLIPWNGGECPVNPDDLVLARWGGSSLEVARAGDLSWQHTNYGGPGDIVGYAVLRLHL